MSNGIQPPQFRYTLQVRGVVDYALPQTPIGWEEGIINWSRSPDFFGMLRSFTVPLKFVEDGARILRDEFYHYGLRSSVKLLIEELDLTTWIYRERYTGDIDFSTTEDETYQVTLTVIEGGMYAKIKAYQDVDYTIDMDVPEAIDIEITPIPLQEENTLIFTPELTDPKADYFTGIQLVTNNIQSLQPSVQSVDGSQDSSPNFATSDKWFYRAQTDTTIHIGGFLQGHLVVAFGGTSKTFRISILDEGGFTKETIVSFASQSVGNHPFNIPLDYDIALATGERLFIYLEIIGGTIADNGFIIEAGQLELTYTTSSISTMCKALRPKYVYQQLIKKMNDDIDYPIQSFHLDAWEQLTITSSDAIRQIDSPKLITSFKDFFQSINSVTNTGFAIESAKAVLESKAYFFKSTMIAAYVGEGKNHKITPYQEYVYNTIKVGYQDYQLTTIVNGKIGVNSTQTWTTPIINIQKELNLVSVYGSDPYIIEDVRITLLDKSTTSTPSDNSCFFIKVKSTPETGQTYYHPERSEGYISLTDLNGNPVPAGSSLYNWSITPKQNLLRHGDFIQSFLDKFEGYELKLASSLKSTDLSIVGLDGVRINEPDNVTIGTLLPKIFLPYLLTVTVKLPVDTFNMVNSFPTGYVRARILDIDVNGFATDISVDVSKNSEREFKLLLTPFNDIVNFIH